jgi:hypothetical protein
MPTVSPHIFSGASWTPLITHNSKTVTSVVPSRSPTEDTRVDWLTAYDRQHSEEMRTLLAAATAAALAVYYHDELVSHPAVKAVKGLNSLAKLQASFQGLLERMDPQHLSAIAGFVFASVLGWVVLSWLAGKVSSVMRWWAETRTATVVLLCLQRRRTFPAVRQQSFQLSLLCFLAEQRRSGCQV